MFLTRALAVLAVLFSSFVAWTVDSVSDYACPSQEASRRVDRIEIAIDLFRIRYDRWPTQAEGLDVLVRPPDGRKPIMTEVPRDPWDQPYALLRIGEMGRVISVGPDGTFGTADDVLDARRARFPPGPWPRWPLALLAALAIAVDGVRRGRDALEDPAKRGRLSLARSGTTGGLSLGRPS